MNNATSVRSSQFITRDGPGSLMPTIGGSILIPNLSTLINYLLDKSKGKDSFNEPDADGKTDLNKFVISDSRMERMLRYFNSKKKQFESEIKVFKLPTNADLRVQETQNILEGYVFPRWGICTQHRGNKIMMKFSYVDQFGTIALECPRCRDQGNLLKRGVPVRFVQACPNGHLQDIFWPGLVHKKSNCSNQIFEWIEIGGDNFVVRCIKCNMQIDYLSENGLKLRSLNGGLKCHGQFPESNIKFEQNDSCDKILSSKGKLVSAAKLILRNAAGLHTPKILTSVQIPKFAGSLYTSLYEIRAILSTYVELKKDWNQNDLKTYLEKIQHRHQIPNDTIYEIENAREEELIKAVNNIIDEMEMDANRAKLKPVSESDANDEELTSLLESAREGFPPSADAGEKRAYVNIDDILLVKSKEFGVTFRITPIRNIQVTKTQVGYSREIGAAEKDLESTQTRIGKLITKSCYHEIGRTRWYMGDQMFGEGIFIDIVKSDIDEPGGLDPLTSKSSDDIDVWSSINDKMSSLLDGASSDNEELKTDVTNSNPRFVWWHTLCHKLLLHLCVDSGFSVVSLGERVYCKKDKHDGTFQSGILIYTAATGGDGTLGGLVGLAEEKFMSELFKKTSQGILSCSNDPVCSDRKITVHKKEGACCHACELLSETTCAYQNRYLDRNLVSGTIK